MLFNSFEYVLFFPLAVGLYFLAVRFIKRNWFTQLLLLVYSLFFYMRWNPAYLALILASVLITWLSGLLMENRSLFYKRLIVFLSLVTNLGILFFFKYYNFFADLVSRFATLARIEVSVPELYVLLPVGISFYTFQALGYTLDVYKGKVKSEKNIVTYALFVTFFPQLVAGPIERTGHLLPQFKVNHSFDPVRVADGLKLIVWGLFKKVTADRLADFINPVYSNAEAPAYISLMAIFLFSFQILCDFSGYSDVAIGSARVLGFDLMTNFRRPYFARSVSDFWRRWHISLSTWFKDYLYFPLGGSRVSRPHHYLNLMITFLVSGLWHGASLNFILWGGLHGLFQIAGHFTKNIRTRIRTLAGIREEWIWFSVWQRLATFFLITFTWVFFRMRSFRSAVRLLRSVFLNAPGDMYRGAVVFATQGPVSFVNGLMQDLPAGFQLHHLVIVLVNIVLLLVSDLLQRKKNGIERVRTFPLALRFSLYVSLSLFVLMLGVFGEEQFIYFQF